MKKATRFASSSDDDNPIEKEEPFTTPKDKRKQKLKDLNKRVRIKKKLCSEDENSNNEEDIENDDKKPWDNQHEDSLPMWENEEAPPDSDEMSDEEKDNFIVSDDEASIDEEDDEVIEENLSRRKRVKRKRNIKSDDSEDDEESYANPYVHDSNDDGSDFRSIINSLSKNTEAFLTQYLSFTSIRGRPTTVFSDKGSQLVKASGFLAAEDPESWDWERIRQETAPSGTTWKYTPPGCQFRNGLAESRIKALKHSLTHVLSGEGSRINYAEFRVFLSRCADVINSRPIGVCHHNKATDEILPLTPNLLLLGRSRGEPSLNALKEEEIKDSCS